MTRTTVLRSAVVLGVASLALAACGGSSGGGSSSSAASSSAPASSSAAAGPLIFGTLLPQTGSLAFLGPPEFAGVNAAIKDINAAGGVFGQPVQKIEGDSGDTSTNIASQTVDSQLQKGVNVIVGAASSSVTLSVIDKVTAAGVVQFSPANTSIKLSDPAITKGLYFRTAPPDTFQGAILAAVASKDARKNVAVMALTDAYGTGLADAFTKNFEASGGKVAARIDYDPKAASYTADVTKVKAANPDAIILIGFDESKKIIQELVAQGIGPQKTPLYLCDGNMGNALADGLPAGLMNGVKGTIPGVQADQKFQQQLLAVDPKLTDYSYAPEAYDAVTIAALAAQAAGSTKGADIAAKIPTITAAGNNACSNYAECLALLQAGKAISYIGPSGATGLKANGDPSVGTMTIWQFGADNKITAVDSVSGDVPAAS
ncbi:MAG: ABC transporter substrate-binding protein [Actinomycetes bacterium]